jgi:prepilin-type N-terminal cleavage/methylation domain-containing protein
MISNHEQERDFSVHRRLRGFTIVELLIALAIASFLILGAATFFSSAHKARQVQTAVSNLNVSGRFGLDQLARDVRMTGYRASNWMAGALPDVLSATNGAALVGGDSITLRFEGPRDCNFALAPGGIVSNTYRVLDGGLVCNGQPIASGIEQMQVYLGEDTDANNVANRWMSPGEDGLDMSRVVSIRLHLLVVTAGNDVGTGAQAYYFNNSLQPAVDDGQIRREYSTTIALRNPT